MKSSGAYCAARMADRALTDKSNRISVRKPPAPQTRRRCRRRTQTETGSCAWRWRQIKSKRWWPIKTRPINKKKHVKMWHLGRKAQSAAAPTSKTQRNLTHWNWYLAEITCGICRLCCNCSTSLSLIVVTLYCDQMLRIFFPHFHLSVNLFIV